MADEELLDGEYKLLGGFVLTQRDWAAFILEHTATYVRDGMYPPDVTAFTLGRALGRALSNCDEPNKLDELLRGYRHYKEQKGER